MFQSLFSLRILLSVVQHSFKGLFWHLWEQEELTWEASQQTGTTVVVHF